MCVLIFCPIFVRNISHCSEEFYEISSQKHIGLHVKNPLLSNFKQMFEKKKKMSSVMQTGTMGAELFRVDGRTDRYNEANSRFSQILQTRLNL